jgi:hypothetical protein
MYHSKQEQTEVKEVGNESTDSDRAQYSNFADDKKRRFALILASADLSVWKISQETRIPRKLRL